MGFTYLDIPSFRLRTIMPSSDVDDLDQTWLQTTLEDLSDLISSRLRKRYAIPFTSPYPPTVLRWLNKLATRECYAKRGWNPTSEQDQKAIEDAAVQAEKELTEAADSEKGLFDLPLRSDLQTSSGVSRGGPFSYSEQSPFSWVDAQRDAISGGGK